MISLDGEVHLNKGGTGNRENPRRRLYCLSERPENKLPQTQDVDWTFAEICEKVQTELASAHKTNPRTLRRWGFRGLLSGYRIIPSGVAIATGLKILAFQSFNQGITNLFIPEVRTKPEVSERPSKSL